MCVGGMVLWCVLACLLSISPVHCGPLYKSLFMFTVTCAIIDFLLILKKTVIQKIYNYYYQNHG